MHVSFDDNGPLYTSGSTVLPLKAGGSTTIPCDAFLWHVFTLMHPSSSESSPTSVATTTGISSTSSTSSEKENTGICCVAPQGTTLSTANGFVKITYESGNIVFTGTHLTDRYTATKQVIQTVPCYTLGRKIPRYIIHQEAMEHLP